MNRLGAQDLKGEEGKTISGATDCPLKRGTDHTASTMQKERKMTVTNVTTQERIRIICKGIREIPRVVEAITESETSLKDDDMYRLVLYERGRQAHLKTYSVEVVQHLSIGRTIAVIAANEGELINADLYAASMDDAFISDFDIDYCKVADGETLNDEREMISYQKVADGNLAEDNYLVDTIDVAPIELPLRKEDDHE
ncbi:hypothetical protein ACFL34_02915 [Candidatus Sumerlaeota bacterium]